MTEQKHTPDQEWFWYQGGSKCNVYDGPLVRGGDTWRIPHGTNHIATISNTGDIEATKEKARLIAATPELLEAAKDAENEIENAIIGLTTDPLAYVEAIKQRLEKSTNTLRSAIHKATESEV
ncbi:hypothetical protein KAR91_52790 [Candidatus Pacearchaeota archaeon]|nr:hypothetical protein [Candidatus Pacearchaeota archaeon]